MLERAAFSQSANSSQAACGPASKSFVPDASIKVDQGLLKSVGAAAWRHAGQSPVPAAAAFNATDVLIRSPDAHEQVSATFLAGKVLPWKTMNCSGLSAAAACNSKLISCHCCQLCAHKQHPACTSSSLPTTNPNASPHNMHYPSASIVLLLQAVTPLLSPQHRTVPFNNPTQALDFETPLFKGKVVVMMKGMASTPAGVFDGKRRLMWMAIQVRHAANGIARLQGRCKDTLQRMLSQL